MDSLKVTGLSTSLGFVYWTDLLSGVLMCIMFAVQIYYLYLKTKKIKESEMDIKSMLIKLAEEQAEKMQEEAINHLGSDEMAEKIATAINQRIDIPFVSEDKEQIFFEKVVDVVTDILEGVFKGK